MTTAELTREPRRCSWGFHRWTIWGAPERYSVVVSTLGGKYTSAPHIQDFQTRTCLLCRKREERVVR